MDTAKDIEVLDLGFNFGLYAMSLAGAAGGMQNLKDPYANKLIELANDRTEDLRRSLKRCGLAGITIKSASELGSHQNVMSYLLGQGNAIAREIADKIVRQMGNRQEKIFLFAVKISQAVGAKKFGYNYSFDNSEMLRMGCDIGLDQNDITRWINDPKESVFSELRQRLQDLVNKMSRPEIVEGDKFEFSHIVGSSIIINSTLSGVTQNINTADGLESVVKERLMELVEQLRNELQKVTPTNQEGAEAVAESVKTFVDASGRLHKFLG